jgi:two-component system sensor histidine kinase YesM
VDSGELGAALHTEGGRMRRKRQITTFSKMMFSFVVFGLLPLLLLSILFFARYTENTKEISIKNYSQINGYFAKNVSDVLDGVDIATKELYEYKTTEGLGLTDILKNEELAENERYLFVFNALQSVMEQSSYISSERFIDYNGNIYSSYHDQDKILKNSASSHTTMNILDEANIRSIKLLGTMDESKICVNSSDFIFVLVRNYMDTSTIENTHSIALGTLFVDVNVEVLENIVEDMQLDKGSFYVYDTSSQQYIFSQDRNDYLDGNHPLSYCEEYLTGEEGYEKLGAQWIFYQKISDTDAYAVLTLDNRDIIGDFFQLEIMMILILSFSCAFLLILYMGFSTHLSAPTRRLKEAMEQAGEGSLDVRVELNTGDEMEYVADGFNKMMERLNDYIDQVYVAQNCQKDAELNALKMQIQPHFLYNTLDVIRMTALEEHDEKSAELLECLAHQLRYVMGEHNERIYLKDELEALREYFVIMKVRYEGKISLHINVANEDQMLVIPKLLLQPVVENAIKHGLREKPGHGTVAISVMRRTDYLQIIVMDDGVGMSEERVKHMQEVLDHPEVGYTDKEKNVSVGMKNVYDRIKLNCGKDYGFTIESVVGMGTIVTYRLPIWEEMEHNVESNNCG